MAPNTPKTEDPKSEVLLEALRRYGSTDLKQVDAESWKAEADDGASLTLTLPEAGIGPRTKALVESGGFTYAEYLLAQWCDLAERRGHPISLESLRAIGFDVDAFEQYDGERLAEVIAAG